MIRSPFIAATLALCLPGVPAIARASAAMRGVFGTVAAGLGFVALTAAITGASPDAQTAIMSLFVGLSYVVLGLWTGMRFAWLGLAVAAVVAIGWFAMPHWLHLWLALGGGGALIVGGLWLRRA